MCGKHLYPSRGAALRGRHGLRVTGRGHGNKGRLIVYFCRDCRAFHVGHREKP
jgi:hypothetical protein